MSRFPDKQPDESFAILNITRGNKITEISEAINCDPPTPTWSQYMSLMSNLFLM